MSESDSTGWARPPAEPPFADSPRSPRLGGDASPYLPKRKSLGHEVPDWVGDGVIFFVTICAAPRGGCPLLAGAIPGGLIDSAEFLHRQGEWFARIFLVMPDHVHALIAVPADPKLAARISAWKGYTAKKLGVSWQSRFFDHRLRSDESLEEKAHYIRMNPVRAGLVLSAYKWPHIFEAFGVGDLNAIDGLAGTHRPT